MVYHSYVSVELGNLEKGIREVTSQQIKELMRTFLAIVLFEPLGENKRMSYHRVYFCLQNSSGIKGLAFP